jgi:ADP-ribose pyrophosphatase YjhB (NUDIX family)
MNYKIKIGVLITDDNNRVLLLKEKTEKILVPMWNTIKGTYGDFKQESIFEAALREAEEETGVKVELLGLLGVYVAQKKDEAWTQFTFLAKIKEGTPCLASQDEQAKRDEFISELKWFTAAEVKEIKPEEFISSRAYTIIENWLQNKIYDIDSIKQIS